MIPTNDITNLVALSVDYITPFDITAPCPVNTPNNTPEAIIKNHM